MINLHMRGQCYALAFSVSIVAQHNISQQSPFAQLLERLVIEGLLV